MPGLFSRIKTWTDLETLTNEDLNAEFDNIINNLIPVKFDDYSSTVTAMRTQTNPGSQGSESLATSLAGELERIRFAISRIIGKTYWYDTPIKSLEAQTFSMVNYFPFDGASSSEALQDTVSRGMDVRGNNGDASLYETIATTNFSTSTSLSKFGRNSLQTSAAFPGILGCIPFRPGNFGEMTVGFHFYNIPANTTLMFNPHLNMELGIDNSGFLFITVTERDALTETTKRTRTVIGNTNVSSLTSWNHVLVSMRYNGYGGANQDSLSLFLNGASIGTPLSGIAINVTAGDGGAWYLYGKTYASNGFTYRHNSMMSVVPTAEAVNPWTGGPTGSATHTPNFSGTGNLFVNTGATAGSTCFYTSSAADNATLNASSGWAVLDFKFSALRVTTNTQVTFSATSHPFEAFIRTSAIQRSVHVAFYNSHILISDGATYAARLYKFDVNNLTPHHWRIALNTTTGEIMVFCDGQSVLSEQLGNAQTVSLSTVDAGSSAWGFGSRSTAGTYWQCFWNMEYVRFQSQLAVSTSPFPVSTNQAAVTSGISDLFITDRRITDPNIITAITTNRANNVVGSDRRRAPYHLMLRDGKYMTTTPVTSFAFNSTTFQNIFGASHAFRYLGVPGEPVEIWIEFVLAANAGTADFYYSLVTSDFFGSAYPGAVTASLSSLNSSGGLVSYVVLSTSPTRLTIRGKVFPTKLGLNFVALMAASSAQVNITPYAVRFGCNYLPS
jgi:hypothetical protein